MPQESPKIDEITGQWEDLIARPEFRGHRVKITIVDGKETPGDTHAWIESLRKMADNGIRITTPADDSRQSIYEGR
ncbi:MAG TPA: hypothetical protein VG722_09060 [Tepidisphaeraceae bacterium]|nr:hypothetical protein [Tepidisphaeraceae bacterium]